MSTRMAFVMTTFALLAARSLGMPAALGGPEVAGNSSQCTTQGSVMLQSSQRRVAAHVLDREDQAGFCCHYGLSCGACSTPSKPGEWCALSQENCEACSAGSSFWCDGEQQGPAPAPAPPGSAPAPAPSAGGGQGRQGGGGGQAGGPEAACESEERPMSSKCTGCPPRFNGKLCASTTRYNDMTKGACGCGESEPVPADWWTLKTLTAALNCKNLDPANPLLSWCPGGCGGCFKLCSTGGTTSGKTTQAGVCRVFTVTNRCGDGYKEYPEWCSQELSYQECESDPARCRQFGSTNKYGYPAHFDLQDYHLQVSSGLGWDNVEVTFEAVDCGLWTGAERKCPQCNLVNTGNWQTFLLNSTSS